MKSFIVGFIFLIAVFAAGTVIDIAVRMLLPTSFVAGTGLVIAILGTVVVGVFVSVCIQIGEVLRRD